MADGGNGMRKRRHLLLKFRQWLITKLGGFNTQIIYEPNVIQAPHHVTLAFEQVINQEDLKYHIAIDYEQMVKRHMAEELAMKLFEQKLLTEVRREDMFGNTVIQYRVAIIPPIQENKPLGLDASIYLEAMKYN